MSLTWKLILGFLFALVLQVAQMLISSYFTAQMQSASLQVSNALAASMAVQNGVDAVHELRKRLRGDSSRSAAGADPKVYRVYLDELRHQTEALTTMFATAAHPTFAQLAQRVDATAPLLQEVEDSLAHPSGERVVDALAFLDDALQETEQALLQAQIHVRSLAYEGVELEREVHDLPMRASLAITVGGVLVMASFVAWFSRQLVIPIEKAWAELETRVAERTAELARTVAALEDQIVERQRAEAQKEELHRQLVDTSRKAGMAELANGVLHNVGNVLNSVNVSANVLLERLRKSKADGLQRAVALMREHGDDLADFLVRSPQGQKLPHYLEQLAAHLLQERQQLVDETGDLSQRIDHMKEIVGRQQGYARVSGVTAPVRLGQLVDDVLGMHTVAFAQFDIRAEKHVEGDDECETDRSRVMQILMNLVSNAKHALRDRGVAGGCITIRVCRLGGDRMQLRVADNGVGIPAENLTRVFAHGFTTKTDGHGFGLHHSANAAAEMGGRLWAESEGLGKGATFVLDLPVRCAGAAPGPVAALGSGRHGGSS